MAASVVRRFSTINVNKTAFFLCDMQERFRPSIGHFDKITEIAQRLIAASKILEIPLIVTEQYPKGLLHTVPELDISHAAGVYHKTKFSMVVPEVQQKMSEICDGKVESVVLFGIEQTALDLMEQYGVDVYLVADATSSRSHSDRMFAFERLRHAGVCITTSESVLFQLLGDKDHPKFKEVQNLVKGPLVDTGLVGKL